MGQWCGMGGLGLMALVGRRTDGRSVGRTDAPARGAGEAAEADERAQHQPDGDDPYVVDGACGLMKLIRIEGWARAVVTAHAYAHVHVSAGARQAKAETQPPSCGHHTQPLPPSLLPPPAAARPKSRHAWQPPITAVQLAGGPPSGEKAGADGKGYGSGRPLPPAPPPMLPRSHGMAVCGLIGCGDGGGWIGSID